MTMSGGPKRIAAVLAAILVVALAAGPARRDAVHAQEGTGRVFALKHSATSRVGAVYELTGGAAVEFARLRTGGWVGALAASPDGRLYAVTDAEDGSLWDVTDGGDLTRAQPKARGLFARTIGLSDT